MKSSNDTPKLNIKNININTKIIISIKYYNADFHSNGLLDTDVTEEQKHVARNFFCHPIDVTGSMYFGNIF